MKGRVHCVLYGHEWSAWQSASDLPIKARQCSVCRERDVMWLNASEYRRSFYDSPPRVEFVPAPTVIQQSWAALSLAWDRVVAWLGVAWRMVVAWLSAAHRTCFTWCRYAAYVVEHLAAVYQGGRRLGAPWWKPPTHARPLSWAEWRAETDRGGEP